MAKGKDVCEELKRIRKQIAKANGIDYQPTLCTHEGDCLGTCPACEQEVRFLTQQLANRTRMGKAVSVIGVATCLTAMAPTLSSCGPVQGDPNPEIMGEPALDTTEYFTDDKDTIQNIPQNIDDVLLLGKAAAENNGTIIDTADNK